MGNEEKTEGIYVSLNGNTLSFYNNKEDAYENKDSEEHYYGNIKEEKFEVKKTPWYNESAKIEKVIIVHEIAPKNTKAWFSKLSELKEIENIDKMDTTSVTDMTSMFYGCNSLTSIDVSKFDTTNVTNMEQMFIYCHKLTNLNLRNFNTTKVTNMKRMFEGNGSLTSIIVGNNWITTNADTTDMFKECGVNSVTNI